MNSEKLGIVIPTYNYAGYLEDAVSSALAAVELTGGHVVVVDDGSTDDTPLIIKKISTQNPRTLSCIRLDKRRGAAFARNEGAKCLNTTYLLFLDSDDLLIPESVKHMVDIMDQHPQENLAYADFQVCDETLFPLFRWSQDRDNGPENQENKLCWDSIIGMPAMVMRRDAFIKIGMFYLIPRAQDWDLALRFMALKPLFYVDCIAHLRRRFNKNTWEKNTWERLNNFLKVKERLEEDKTFAFSYPDLHKKRFACIYRFIGETLIILGQFREAAFYLDKAEALVDCFADISLLRGRLLMAQGRFKQAIRLITTEKRPYFLKDGPITRLILLSSLFEKTNKIDAAAETLLQAVKNRPQRFDLYYKLGKLHLDNQNHIRAIEWFHRLSLSYTRIYHNFHVSAFYNLARLYQINKKEKNACYALECCLRLEPGHREARKMLNEIKS